jgi:Histone methylation protein DOT1
MHQRVRKVKMFALLDRFRGRGYKDRLLNPHDEFWDRKLGVQTFGYHPGEGEPGDLNWKVHYSPTPYSDIFRLLRLVNLKSGDVFVDLGAGMGRAVFAASWLGASRAIGVEVVQHLCDKGERNYFQSRLVHQNIQFISMGAEDYRNPDMTVCFMFHPFGEATLTKVMRNMEFIRSGKKVGKLRIVYVNPVYDSILRDNFWLECIGRVPARRRWPSIGDRYETSLWQSREP